MSQSFGFAFWCHLPAAIPLNRSENLESLEEVSVVSDWKQWRLSSPSLQNVLISEEEEWDQIIEHSNFKNNWMSLFHENSLGLYEEMELLEFLDKMNIQD